jgi:aspartyl-tRNA(Asn)/glutamyl-tRNA(Gln) amidotransferase subunit A
MVETVTWSAARTAEAVRRRELSAVEVVQAALARVERLEPRLNAFATLTPQLALDDARRVDAVLAAGGDPGPLAGVPVTVKDLIAVGGVRQAFGSRLLAHNVAAHDAPAVARLRAAGACLLGKTTTSELGSKAVGDSPLTGFTRNPWNLAHTAGGSSAGAAASVASGMVPVALGTDGGGSIRIPGSFCGLVGIKASFGRVPVWPASATPSVAHVAPLARSVADAVLLLSVIAGHDPRDPGALDEAVPDFAASLRADVRGLRVGWCPSFGYGHVAAEVLHACEQAALSLRAHGAGVHTAPPPFATDPGPAWNHLFYGAMRRRVAELATSPEQLRQVTPALLDAIAQQQAHPLGEEQAAALRAQARQELACAFEACDVLLSPTMPVTAPEVGVDVPRGHEGRNAVDWSYFTYPFNLTGHPALTVPVGRDAAGLPIGLQVVGRPGDEATAIRVAAAIERLAGFDTGLALPV